MANQHVFGKWQCGFGAYCPPYPKIFPVNTRFVYLGETNFYIPEHLAHSFIKYPPGVIGIGNAISMAVAE